MTLRTRLAVLLLMTAASVAHAQPTQITIVQPAEATTPGSEGATGRAASPATASTR
ncbi:MAG TPA: hypothetical protein VIE41_01500 [Methylomirabilota bacterium]|jgi:hypothetical protein